MKKELSGNSSGSVVKATDLSLRRPEFESLHRCNSLFRQKSYRRDVESPEYRYEQGTSNLYKKRWEERRKHSLKNGREIIEKRKRPYKYFLLAVWEAQMKRCNIETKIKRSGEQRKMDGPQKKKLLLTASNFAKVCQLRKEYATSKYFEEYNVPTNSKFTFSGIRKGRTRWTPHDNFKQNWQCQLNPVWASSSTSPYRT